MLFVTHPVYDIVMAAWRDSGTISIKVCLGVIVEYNHKYIDIGVAKMVE